MFYLGGEIEGCGVNLVSCIQDCKQSVDKILLRRQRFSQKFSSTHEAICRCDVSPHLVAATSRPTCTHGVIGRRDVLLQLVA